MGGRRESCETGEFRKYVGMELERKGHSLLVRLGYQMNSFSVTGVLNLGQNHQA